MKITIITAGLTAIVISFYSCILPSKFTEEQNKRKACEAQLAAIKAADDDCETKRTELQAKVDLLQNEVARLQQDTALTGVKYRETADKYENLNELN